MKKALKSNLFLILILLVPLAVKPPSVDAAQKTIEFRTIQGSFSVPMEESNGTIFVDYLKIASSLGVTPYIKKKVSIMDFPTFTVAVHAKNTKFSILEDTQDRWKNYKFKKPAYRKNKSLMAPLESLPDFFLRTFTYHRQRKILWEELPDPFTIREGFKLVRVRHVMKGRNIWVSLEDLADLLRIVMYSSQSQIFNLVLPDFTNLQLRIGQRSVLKRNTPIIQLNDPPLLFSGSPYISLSSIQPLLGIEAEWNDKSKKLLIPEQFGRLEDLEFKRFRLNFSGYIPHKFKLNLDEITSYYQEPQPIFPASHEDVYESVRDSFTNLPIEEKNSRREDRFGGEAIVDLKWNLLNSPLEGRGAFEKVGSTTRLINGSFLMGHPLFRLQGGREYTTMHGLNNQFNVVDQVTLSHSNDLYGDNLVNPKLSYEASYGQNDFLVFMSTSLFSQTVNFNQNYGRVSAEWMYEYTRHHNLTVKLEQYYFDNEAKDVESRFHDQDFLEDIFGDDFVVFVDPSEEESLIKTLLSDRHYTTFLNAEYEAHRSIKLNGIFGNSYYRDESNNDKSVFDQDWLLKARLGREKARITASYESVGHRFRSLGDPNRYQDREIIRLSPFFNPFKFWRIYGEYRREDSEARNNETIPPYSNIYLSAVNTFSLKSNILRGSVTEFDSGLFGRRLTTNGTYTRLLGKHSFDVGGGKRSQWTTRDQLFKESNIGKVGFRLNPRKWQFSTGFEYTWNDYPLNNIERIETLTNVILTIGQFKSYFQYERKPRFFLEETMIYTGLVRMGYKINRRQIFNLFYSGTSLHNNLRDPEVWRVGLELIHDF